MEVVKGNQTFLVVTYWKNMVQSDEKLVQLHVIYLYLLSRGINVLKNKTELEKVLSKQRKASEQKSREAEKEVEDELHTLLSERAKRLEEVGIYY